MTERFIQSIKRECLQRFILFGQRHLDYIASEWVAYYNVASYYPFVRCA